MAVTVPAIALAGALVASQSEPGPVNPVASSMAAYHLRPMLSVAALVRGQGSGNAAGRNASQGQSDGHARAGRQAGGKAGRP